MSAIPAEAEAARSVVGAVALGLVAFAASTLLLVNTGAFSLDEAWFVQVVRRVVAGEVLYRDIACGVTPLAVYLSAGLARVFGVGLLVLYVEQAALFAITVVVALRILRRLGWPRRRGLDWAWTTAFVAWAPAGSTLSLYTPLATLGLLWCLDACLQWFEATGRAARRAAAWAGCATAAAFCAKQNVGLLSGFALAFVLLGVGAQATRTLRERLIDFGVALAVAVLVAAVVLAPVFASGAGGAFLDYGFLGKRAYVEVGVVDPLDTLRDWYVTLLASDQLSEFRRFATFQAPMLTIATLAALARVAARGSTTRKSTAIVASFVLTAVAGALPRLDWPHVFAVMPLVLVGAGYVLTRLWADGFPRAHPLVLAAFGLALVGASSRLVGASSASTSPDVRRSELAGLSHVLVPSVTLDATERATACLAGLLPLGERAFLLSARAGLLSLALELENPLPFDYPLVTTLGQRGEDGVIGALEERAVPLVCIDEAEGKRSYGPLWPARLERYVEQHFFRIAAACDFVLYARVPTRRSEPHPSQEPAVDAVPSNVLGTIGRETAALAPSETALVHRYFHSALAHHLYTTDPRAELAVARGYVYQGPAFRLLIRAAPNTRALYEWYNPRVHDYFYTTDPGGELAPRSGYVAQGELGAVAKNHEGGTIPLYRFFSQARTDHFYTTDPRGARAPSLGYVFEGIVGYVLPPVP